jgi:hypothetical protein
MNLYYVQAQGDTFIRHIHDVEPTRWDDNNFCFVINLTPEQVVQFGVHQLKLITPPYFDPATQRREHGPALLIDGVWTQNYIVTNLDADESAAKVGEQWTVIRAERNALLVASDWTQVADAPVDAVAWAVYRQALRDITEQASPFNIVWPTPPAV